MVAPSTLDHICRGLIVAWALVTTPAFAADANNGERLAHRWCAACPKIALFLLDPHPKMPDMGLSRTEAADLAAYIASLK